MKTQITTTEQPTMMSSREIAELTGKDVNKVHRDIRAMVPALYSVDSGDDVKSYAWGTSKSDMDAFLVHHNIQGVKPNYDDRGYVYEFLLDRRHTEILISGYDIKRRAAIIDRWHALESGKAQPRIAAQEVQSVSTANHDVLSLARVVAEATASATMKALMEATGIQALTGAQVLPHIDEQLHVQEPAQATQRENTPPADIVGYVQVTKIAWETTFSDAACRRLIEFASLPTMKYKGSHGLQVHRESFMDALKELIAESTPPAGKLKRWQHPEFGGFALRKDPKEIFGEAE
ncbi:transcriptional regulator [Salmonella enterica subsp. enterica serovar Reading]|nr:transcriptional regulator [Salmonella enterica subsp. enterica serovar Reading]